MMLLSCLNCCHNPLQTDSLGAPAGYCTEHKKILLQPSQLTCGLHFRKDLAATRAIELRDTHERHFSPGIIVHVAGDTGQANGGYTSTSAGDLRRLEQDDVARAVVDYGRLESKIGSIAQLRNVPGVRSEVAMVALGRAYVNRCVARGGKWTSGVHLLWWTRQQILREPRIDWDDLRVESAVPLDRQVALAQWFVVMMRIIFISDVGYYAKRDDRKVARLASFAEQAAEQSPELSPKRLLSWLKRDGVKRLDEALSVKRYEQIAARLRAESADA